MASAVRFSRFVLVGVRPFAVRPIAYTYRCSLYQKQSFKIAFFSTSTSDAPAESTTIEAKQSAESTVIEAKQPAETTSQELDQDAWADNQIEQNVRSLAPDVVLAHGFLVPRDLKGLRVVLERTKIKQLKQKILNAFVSTESGVEVLEKLITLCKELDLSVDDVYRDLIVALAKQRNFEKATAYIQKAYHYEGVIFPKNKWLLIIKHLFESDEDRVSFLKCFRRVDNQAILIENSADVEFAIKENKSELFQQVFENVRERKQEPFDEQSRPSKKPALPLVQDAFITRLYQSQDLQAAITTWNEHFERNGNSADLSIQSCSWILDYCLAEITAQFQRKSKLSLPVADLVRFASRVHEKLINIGHDKMLNKELSASYVRMLSILTRADHASSYSFFQAHITKAVPDDLTNMFELMLESAYGIKERRIRSLFADIHSSLPIQNQQDMKTAVYAYQTLREAESTYIHAIRLMQSLQSSKLHPDKAKILQLTVGQLCSAYLPQRLGKALRHSKAR